MAAPPPPKHEPSSRSPLTARPTSWALTALLLGACAGSAGSSEPEWPEQPSPAYPSTTASAASTPPPAAPLAPAPSAPSWAAAYADKPALETLQGKATYYADSLAGNATASGAPYDPQAFTAAHKKLPFGTVVRVVRTDTSAITYAKINDRGPFGPADRIIDLSRAAADQLDMKSAGVVSVRVEVLEKPAAK